MHEQFLFDEFDTLIHVFLRVTVVLGKECRAESLEYLVIWREQREFLVSKCVPSLLRGSLLAGRGAAAVGRSHSQSLLDMTYLFVSFGIQPLRSVSAPRPTCRGVGSPRDRDGYLIMHVGKSPRIDASTKISFTLRSLVHCDDGHPPSILCST